MKKTKLLILITALIISAVLTACGSSGDSAGDTRTVTDSAGREVEIPAKVERIVCLNVGTLRYTCYMEAQDLVVGVEDYEQERSVSRPYNYLNFENFSELPVIGTNEEHYPEAIIEADPDVIMMSSFGSGDPDNLQEQTGIPVVQVPGSDSMMDENAYDTVKIMGEVYGKEDRAEELISYMDNVKKDLNDRTSQISDGEKPAVYVGGLSYKGAHGIEGTEGGYGPFAAINAKNLADEAGKEGPFDIDTEQILQWNPDILFVDYDGLALINEDYGKNSEFYNSLTAVIEGDVYAQIPFRSYASNLDTALADAYYAGTVIFPEEFSDVDPGEKADEIFNMLLGDDFYSVLSENGYEFGKISLGN